MVGKNPAVLQTRTQDRHCTIAKGTEGTGIEQTIQEDFIWGVGPEALYQKTRAEYKTEPDNIKDNDLIRLFTEIYISKRNTYHNRGDCFWAKQTEEETPEKF